MGEMRRLPSFSKLTSLTMGAAQFRGFRAKMVSPQEQNTLTKLLHAEHYSSGLDEGTTDSTRIEQQRWYAAEMEMHWIVQWAERKHAGDLEAQAMAVKRAVLERVDYHKPLSYIIGNQPFFQSEIICRPPLLIPRTETEEMVHWLHRKYLKAIEGPIKMLDMCCGTGCIGVSLARKTPTLNVLCADVSPEAVACTTENAEASGVADRVKVLQSDMFESVPIPEVKEDLFDILISNPPYILETQYSSLPRSVKSWEDKLCLVGDGKREGVKFHYYEELCTIGHKYVKKAKPPSTLKKIAAAIRGEEKAEHPNIVLELGIQAENVALLFDQSKLWKDVELHMDHSGQPRWLAACAIDR